VNFASLRNLSIIKTLSLVLILLWAQFSLAGHVHDVDYESCSTCLMVENNQLDEVIPVSLHAKDLQVTDSESFSKASYLFLYDKRLRTYHLRGPPVKTQVKIV